MCGLAGFFTSGARSLGADPESLLTRMSGTLRHRGPDSHGVWHDIERGIGLSHRRLSIGDLSDDGHQPKASASQRWMIVFNGEIYNFLDLRRELEALGHGFRGGSDTEVLLAAIEQWGLEGALDRSAGMFALALWDRAEGVLHLARDRLGKKPLYIASQNGLIAFASELKAMHCLPGLAMDVDRDVLTLQLRYGYVPEPFCIYENFFKLPPGTTLSLRQADIGSVDVASLLGRAKAFWSARAVAQNGAANQFEMDDEEAIERLDQLLREVVAERMIADVPIGAFLSGGIDSSLVVAMMQAEATRPVRTFSIGFEPGDYDEAKDAKRVAEALGTDHTELYVDAEDALAVIPTLPEIYDEPFSDPSQIPTFLLCQMARRDVTVALSGDGGDESFGGYQRYLDLLSFSNSMAPFYRLPTSIRRATGRCAAMLSVSAWDKALNGCQRLLPHGIADRLSGQRMQTLGEIADSANATTALYKRLMSRSLHRMDAVVGGREPPTAFDVEGWQQEGMASFTEWMMFTDTVDYLPGDILVKVDRASMAESLEVRCPLLDHRVVEFAWRLPQSMKVRSGKGKWILREILERYIPRSLFERPKQGFGVPMDAWLRGPLRDWAEGLLEPARLRDDGFFHVEPIQRIWREHLSGDHDRSMYLWSVLMFQAWLTHWHGQGVDEMQQRRSA